MSNKVRIYTIKNKKKLMYGIDYIDPVTGIRIRKITSSNKKHVIEKAAKVVTEIHEKGFFENKKILNKAVVVVKDEYLIKEKSAGSKKKYPERDEYILTRFMEFVPPSKGHKKIREMSMLEIDTEVIEDYKANRAISIGHFQ
jgi:hypothetical protein